MPLTYIPSPTIACEQSIALYLSASISASYIDPDGSYLNIYTGIDNENKHPPALIVYCKNASEVYFNTRNYAFDVEITVKQLAADDTISDYETLAGNVFSYFGDSVTSSLALNSSSVGIKFWQIQMMGFEESHNQDAWVGTLNLKLIGALTPTS